MKACTVYAAVSIRVCAPGHVRIGRGVWVWVCVCHCECVCVSVGEGGDGI